MEHVANVIAIIGLIGTVIGLMVDIPTLISMIKSKFGKDSGVATNIGSVSANNPKNHSKRLGYGTFILCVGIAFVVGALWSPFGHKTDGGDVSSDFDFLISSDEFSGDEPSSVAISSDVTSSSEIEEGKPYYMGYYPQGENGETQMIEWRVLKVKNGEALLISEKLLDYVTFNSELENVKWDNCTLRTWMNSTFYDKAFSSSEKNRIQSHSNSNPTNKRYGISGCGTTVDKVFALSIDEANTYFPSYGSGLAYTTDYAHTKKQYKDQRADFWWLRSPGFKHNHAANMSDKGKVEDGGSNVANRKIAVRPAIWIKV